MSIHMDKCMCGVQTSWEFCVEYLLAAKEERNKVDQKDWDLLK